MLDEILEKKQLLKMMKTCVLSFFKNMLHVTLPIVILLFFIKETKTIEKNVECSFHQTIIRMLLYNLITVEQCFLKRITLIKG